MRKIMILAAMMAMMLAMASPAFAHATGGDVDVLDVDASQTATVDATQTQNGDATATSGDVASAASASIDNSLDISVEQTIGGFDHMWLHHFMMH